MTQTLPFAKYEVWLLHPARDEALAVIDDFTLLEYAKRTNHMGNFRLLLAEESMQDLGAFMVDGRIIVWREPYHGSKYIDFAGFGRFKERSYQDVLMYEWAGPDYNDLLRRRIVAYPTSTSQSDKSDYADDMAKEVVYENLGAGAVAARDLTAYGLSIERDLSQGTQIEMEDMAWQPLPDVLTDIADQSAETPETRIYFGFVPYGENGWQMRFETKTARWGIDHTEDSTIAEPLVFAIERGNLENPSYFTDRRLETNYMYGGGPGEDADRVIVERNSSQVYITPYNRCEGFYDGRQHDGYQALWAQTHTKLIQGWLRRGFTGALLDTPDMRYGLHYGLGDSVTASYLGDSYDVTIDAVHILVEPKAGTERITPTFEDNVR